MALCQYFSKFFDTTYSYYICEILLKMIETKLYTDYISTARQDFAKLLKGRLQCKSHNLKFC